MSLKVERGRTLARSQALQLLFQAEILGRTVDDVLAGDYLLARASEEASPLVPYAAELARGCYAHISEIDRGLARVSENWALDRMPGSDRNLLRLAVYELRFSPERVDDAVVINEAVEIAKAYGTDESASFVNGVLGRVVRDSRIFPRPVDSTPAEDSAAPALVAQATDPVEAAEPAAAEAPVSSEGC